MSKEPYDKDLDEYRCGNILICADAAFQDISVISIGKFVNKNMSPKFEFVAIRGYIDVGD